jgi:hypothetical protein
MADQAARVSPWYMANQAMKEFLFSVPAPATGMSGIGPRILDARILRQFELGMAKVSPSAKMWELSAMPARILCLVAQAEMCGKRLSANAAAAR